MDAIASSHLRAASAGAVFDRLVVGIDGTEAGLEACRQALRLADPHAELELVSAMYLVEAVRAGWSAVRMTEELEREAGAALREAEALAGDCASGRLVNGPPVKVLLQEVERRRATLLALGTHGHSRASEILVGGVAGEMLHDAPCSVLIARAPSDPAVFPAAIVVGVDGSPEAGAALAAAAALQRRFGADLRVLAALGGKHVDSAQVQRQCPTADLVDAHPVDALVRASGDADLVVVGSRGLHGIVSLGSVSERVAHRARSSVLVVRS